MKRQGLVVLAVAFVAAAATGCFKDPTSGLKNGPKYMTLSDAATILRTGDSIAVVATLKDSAGAALSATGADWKSLDGTIATARLDTTTIPANAFTRGFIVAVSPTGGWTYITVASRGVTDSIRVTVLPAGVTASLVTRTGAATADTAGTTVISAPDTLVISGTTAAAGSLNFDTSAASVAVGGVAAPLIAKTPTKLTAVVLAGASGSVVVRKVLFVSGTTSIGTIKIDSLIGPSVALSRVRFRGTITQLGDTMTITASANQTFLASTGVKFGTTAGIVLSQTATTLSVLSPVAYSGQVTVTGLTMGAAAISAVTTNAATPYSMNAATFPAANVTFNPNNKRMYDTVKVAAPTGLSFKTSGSVSNVILGPAGVPGDTAWVLSRTATLLLVLPRRGGTAPATVTNLALGSGAVIPKLSTPANVPVDSLLSDQVPATTKATARLLTITAANDTTNPVVVYGTMNSSTLAEDFWTLTLTATAKIRITLTWFGTGNPYAAGLTTSQKQNNPDVDAVVCNATMACDESDPTDLTGYAAAQANMPESATTKAAQVAGQYWIGVIPFHNVTGDQYTMVYQLKVSIF